MPLTILATFSCLILISSVIICLLSVVWCQEGSRDHQGGWVAILQVERRANHPLPWRRGVLWSLWSLTKPSWCLALDTLPLNSTPPPECLRRWGGVCGDPQSLPGTFPGRHLDASSKFSGIMAFLHCQTHRNQVALCVNVESSKGKSKVISFKTPAFLHHLHNFVT